MKEEEKKKRKKQLKKEFKDIDVKEHVDALMNGEGDLSEDFKRKAATVFEAAVKSKIRDEVVRMENKYKTELDESIEETKEELSEKVDTYLNYVVEEWMKENELAVERGLKGEIAEDFHFWIENNCLKTIMLMFQMKNMMCLKHNQKRLLN